MKIIVISEIGVNHSGDMGKLEKMIYTSRDAGVDGIKLQYYDVKDLDVSERLKKALLETQLTIDQIKEAKEITEKCGLKFLCTPMVRFEMAEDLAKIGLKWVKIREKDSYDYDFIKNCLFLFDRLYISTVRRPIGDMFLFYHPKIKWVYTIPKYPASFSDIDLSSIGSWDGYSNHVPSIVAPLSTCVIAKQHEKPEWYLEVHFTLDHKLNDIDDDVSLDIDELTRLVELVRELE